MQRSRSPVTHLLVGGMACASKHANAHFVSARKLMALRGLERDRCCLATSEGHAAAASQGMVVARRWSVDRGASHRRGREGDAG